MVGTILVAVFISLAVAYNSTIRVNNEKLGLELYNSLEKGDHLLEGLSFFDDRQPEEGFAILASMYRAKAYTEQSDYTNAIATYKNIIKSSQNDFFRDVAKIYAACLENNYRLGLYEVESELNSLVQDSDNPLTFFAMEQLAVHHLLHGNISQSVYWFDIISSSSDVSTSIRAVAEQALYMINMRGYSDTK